MIVEYPLTKANRIKLASAFRNVARVDLSIECTTEAQMGRAFVDDPERPTVFKVETGLFFYLAGDAAGQAAGEVLRNIAPYTLFMPSAPGWLEAAQALYEDRLVGFDRYSFSPDKLAVARLEQLRQASLHRERVQRMDLDFVKSVWGQEHYVDLSAYDSAVDFIQRGVGYIIADGNSPIGAAFASLVCSRGIEVSIYVEEQRRRQGIATALASVLLLWCLQHNLEPHWDAANPESCKLALKLGYSPAGSYLAYYLRE